MMSKGESRKAEANAPLTDPADFWTMVGRFVAAQVINVLLASALIAKSWPSAVLFAIVSLVLHRLFIRQYRNLRKLRLEAIEARLHESKHGGEECP